MSSLALTLLYLLAAVLGVVVCRSLKLPPMLGYLAAGVLIGPHALALAQNSEGVRHLGEFGVVFLMFAIGLEFSLPKLRAMRRQVFGLGLMQVVLSMLVVTGLLLALAHLAGGVWAMGWQSALALSGVLAMSSTAIVVKLMAERSELESEHGHRVMGILLFQDLAVVPLLVLIPALGSSPDRLLTALGLALLKAAVLVGLLLTGGQRVMRWWLTQVARRKSDELFMLNLLLITLGLAWLTDLAGLSLALGAFIAGVLVSETEYRHQVGTDIRPFHDVLLGLFFITIGMLLDWHILLDRWALVLVLITVPLLLKLVLILVLARGMGATTGVALRTGLYLAQAGEFGFVLLSLTLEHGLVQPALMNPILAAMVLSMLATPFLIMYSNRIVMKLVASDWLQQSLQMTTIARKSINTSKHVIICGFGRCGQNLARMLEREGIPWSLLALDDQIALGVFGVGKGDAAVFDHADDQHVARDGVLVVHAEGLFVGGHHAVIGFHLAFERFLDGLAGQVAVADAQKRIHQQVGGVVGVGGCHGHGHLALVFAGVARQKGRPALVAGLGNEGLHHQRAFGGVLGAFQEERERQRPGAHLRHLPVQGLLAVGDHGVFGAHGVAEDHVGPGVAGGRELGGEVLHTQREAGHVGGLEVLGLQRRHHILVAALAVARGVGKDGHLVPSSFHDVVHHERRLKRIAGLHAKHVAVGRGVLGCHLRTG